MKPYVPPPLDPFTLADPQPAPIQRRPGPLSRFWFWVFWGPAFKTPYERWPRGEAHTWKGKK